MSCLAHVLTQTRAPSAGSRRINASAPSWSTAPSPQSRSAGLADTFGVLVQLSLCVPAAGHQPQLIAAQTDPVDRFVQENSAST